MQPLYVRQSQVDSSLPFRALELLTFTTRLHSFTYSATDHCPHESQQKQCLKTLHVTTIGNIGNI